MRKASDLAIEAVEKVNAQMSGLRLEPSFFERLKGEKFRLAREYISLLGQQAHRPGNKLQVFEGVVRLASADVILAPGGLISATGVAGLTLSGGIGWLRGRHGLSADNLLAADVITADGHLIRASDTENTDLLWALRGGGGNFGVVVNFELALHAVEPELMFCGRPIPRNVRTRSCHSGATSWPMRRTG